jgi:hypothetical protein
VSERWPPSLSFPSSNGEPNSAVSRNSAGARRNRELPAHPRGSACGTPRTDRREAIRAEAPRFHLAGRRRTPRMGNPIRPGCDLGA